LLFSNTPVGIIPEADVTMVKYAPMGDPVELRIHGYSLTLRLADAEKIKITDIRENIIKATEAAAANLVKMREVEGEKLAEDLIAKGENIKSILDKIAERSPLVVKEYTAKLRDRIAELIAGNAQIPEDRILTEAAIFADKCAIDEEITRLNSHLIQLKKILTSNNDAEGKKLDFLVQEMNREANTIGSKANDITITNYMLEIKSEIEKIREQVQNIE